MIVSAPMLFAFAEDLPLARRLASAADAELGELATHTFPDGETYLRLMTDCAMRDVIIVCSLHQPNARALPLLFLADTARQHDAARVGLVAPYLGYMRQDIEFQPGEAVTARTFGTLFSNAVDWIMTVDPHLHRIRRLSDVYRIPAVTLHATREVGEWIAEHVSTPIVIGPDRESVQWASRIAREAACPYVVLDKVRRGDASVTVSLPDDTRFTSSTPVLVDDIIATGRTMVTAAEQLRARGAAPPVCVGVHAVFVAGAHDALVDAGVSRIVTTNTIEHESNAIDVVPLIAHALHERARFD